MKQIFKRALSLILSIGLILISASCAATPPVAPADPSSEATISTPDVTPEAETLPNPGPKDKYYVYFSQRAMNHPWNVAMTNSFTAAAEKYADRISKYEWTDGNNDDADQLSDIEDMLKTKPDVLFLSAQSFESLAAVAEMCRKSGTVLFTVDRRINAVAGEDYACWIGADYRDEGRMAAKELAEKLFQEKGEYKGNVIEISGTAGASAAIDRAAGFADEISKYPDIKIIATQDGDFTRDTAMTVMENFMQKYAVGEVDAVYTHNDEMAIGVVEAIKKTNRTELYGWIVSVDGQKEALEYVIDGKMLATAQCPAGYGELSLETAFAYLDGEEVPSEIYIPFQTFSNRTPELLKATEEYYKNMIANKEMY